MLQCVHCATPIPDDSRFCLNCGSNVSDADGQKRASSTMDASSTARMERVLRQDTKGEFEIEGQLGQGGMAAVYLATEIRLGRKVAIKVLPPELTFGHGIERFVREAKTAAALDHPHIIPIYRITASDSIFWYAMKYIEGKSLDDLVKEQKLFSVEDTVRILGQAADALEYAHRKMVIHRDVKPGNMMIDDQDRVIVTDFGIAKALTEGTLTASGAAIGTPYYMSPEQGIGGTVSGAADQYSLGIVAYQMLSGQLPYTGESVLEIVHKHSHEPPPPLEVLRPGLPKYVYAAVTKAIAKKPADRHPAIRDFIRAMQNQPPRASSVIPTPGGAAPVRFSKTEAVKPKKKPRRALVVAATAGVVAVGAGAVFVLNLTAPEAIAPAAVTPPVAAARPDSQPVRNDSVVPPSTPAAVPPDASPRPTLAAPALAAGRIFVSGLPRGGRWYLDDRQQSRSTVDAREGRHIVRMEADGFQPFIDTVESLRGGGTARIAWVGTPIAPAPAPVAASPDPAPSALGSRGVLILSVSPWANISINALSKGQSRTLEDTLRAGSHRVSLVRDGYARVDTTISIRAGQVHRVAITLQPSTP